MKAVLLLGSNSGNRFDYINKAEAQVKAFVGKIILKSSVYETSPWGFIEQPDFLNQVIVVDTTLAPTVLLKQVKIIEKNLGRIINEKWKQRIIDIDILFYDEMIFKSEELEIPHPLLQERRFTLIPLNEIMPEFRHPVLNKKVNELLTECIDKGEVKVNLKY